jgi:hypothetical protein
MRTKRCCRCGLEKVVEMFRPRHKGHGLLSECRPCEVRAGVERRRRNKTARQRKLDRDRQRAAYALNPEPQKARARAYHHRTKGKFALLVAGRKEQAA